MPVDQVTDQDAADEARGAEHGDVVHGDSLGATCAPAIVKNCRRR
jgi:hypothetical protein